MHNVQFGRTRDNRIISLLEECKALTRYQIQQIFFDFPSGKRKSQERLSKLYSDGRIKKYHKDLYSPSLYYLEKKPINLNHILQINDVYCAMMKQKKPYQIIEWEWEVPIMGGKIIPDAIINFYTQPGRKGREVIFLEVELDLRKKFTKDVGYNSIWEMDYTKEPWVVIENNKAIFPTILIVTEHKPEINSKLRFITATPSQIQQDIFSLIKRSDIPQPLASQAQPVRQSLPRKIGLSNPNYTTK